MNVFDKREKVLELQQEMLVGAKERDSSFLSLVNLENWCCNSGLSGFVHNFITINNMISVVQKFLNQYGKDFIDKLNEEEFEFLSQYDHNFYDILDQYTDAVYMKYVNEK
jgi:hypothetical protein